MSTISVYSKKLVVVWWEKIETHMVNILDCDASSNIPFIKWSLCLTREPAIYKSLNWKKIVLIGTWQIIEATLFQIEMTAINNFLVLKNERNNTVTEKFIYQCVIHKIK